MKPKKTYKVTTRKGETKTVEAELFTFCRQSRFAELLIGGETVAVFNDPQSIEVEQPKEHVKVMAEPA